MRPPKLFSPFRLLTEVTIKTVGCDGMVNAWYEVQESRPTVTVCYEYLHVIVQHAQLGKERARGLIGGAAYAYMGYAKDYKENPKVAIPLEALSSNHGSPEERFYNLLCIAFGADPQLFADVVETGYLPKTRAGSCRYEYRALAKAIRGEIGRMSTGRWPTTFGSRTGFLNRPCVPLAN